VAAAVAALLCALAWGAAGAHAQDAPPLVPADAGQGQQHDAPAPVIDLSPLTKGLDQLPEKIAGALWDYTGGRVLKAFAGVLGFFLLLAKALARGAMGNVNFFTQIPEPWVTLEALGAIQARLARTAVAVGGLAAALIL
jgi:hypothetical protein